MTQQSRPRGPALAYSAIVVIALVLLATFALTARQPPPPTIAEFAPQAIENITDAPDDQSSKSGRSGGLGPGGSLETPAPAPLSVPSIAVSRVRRCIGDPPRQIEDPQSPPCVPYWAGDNGGATTRGVTRDEIVIAEGGNQETLGPAYAAFFNSRFEFYGRKIRIERFEASGEEDANMMSDAVRVDEQIQAFASVNYQGVEGHDYLYYEELARRKIIGITSPVAQAIGEDFFRAHDPYVWSYLPGFDKEQLSEGRWICSSLNGKPADFARGNERGKPRVFGMIHSSAANGDAPDMGPLLRTLKSCGITPAASADNRTNLNDQVAQENAILQMKTNGVTSIICLCSFAPTHQATHQAYFPEWLIGHFGNNDVDLAGQIQSSSGQWESAFGLGWWNKQLRPDDSPWVWAVRETDPGYVVTQTSHYSMRPLYESMLIVASGIQAAGPRLTPVTFRDGLRKTRFPNPNAGAAPYFQATIGFADGHAAQQDANVIWWNSAADSPWGPGGTYCVARLGQRYSTTAKAFPSDYGGLYQLPCW